jgi:uncharacterized lipoprotein YmbA
VNNFYLRFALACLMGGAVGCTAAPVRYYTLSRPPDNASRVTDTSLLIDVRVVHTPPQLDRAELMLRTGPGEVMLLENERWASPVADEIKDAMRLELQRRLGRMSGLPPAFTRLTLDIDVQRLESELGRHALIAASWSATLTATSEPSVAVRTATCTFQVDQKINAGYPGIVEGYQREIAALADVIVVALTRRESLTDASCR